MFFFIINILKLGKIYYYLIYLKLKKPMLLKIISLSVGIMIVTISICSIVNESVLKDSPFKKWWENNISKKVN